MLEVKNIYKTFNVGTANEKHALNGVELTMEDGDFITVIGIPFGVQHFKLARLAITPFGHDVV